MRLHTSVARATRQVILFQHVAMALELTSVRNGAGGGGRPRS